MKKLPLILIALLTTAALAGNFSLDWTASPSAGVSHYRIYSSTNTTAWAFVRNVTNATSVTVSNITSPPVVAFAVSAVGTNGNESVKAVSVIVFPPSSLTISEAP